jgi:hypothetical protein
VYPLMVRSAASRVSNHAARCGPSFETAALRPPQDEVLGVDVGRK